MDGLKEHQAKAATLRNERNATLAALQARVAEAAKAQAAVDEAKILPEQQRGDALRAALAVQQSAGAALASSRQELLGVEVSLGEWLGAAISDPRRRIDGLDDRTPILLFPVRIETRFFGGTDSPELRVRIFPDDIAITTHETALTAGETAAARLFWSARAAAMQIVDLAAREKAIEGAWTSLVQDHGEARGSFLLLRMRPDNWHDAAPPLPANLVFPDPGPEQPATVAGAVPRSRIMPDRFVVRLAGGGTVIEALGNPIPDDLLVGPDPKQLETVLVRDPATGRLQPDSRLAWLFDFDAAVEVGLGVRIAIPPARLRTGFDHVMVLGLKLSVDPAAGATLAHGLIEAHRYTGGFDLLSQGTPTNNTERVPAGFSSDPRPTPSLYARIVQGKRATPATEATARSDAEFLSTALGIDLAAVDALPNAVQTDIGEALAMNRALWPATIGNYLAKMVPSALPAPVDAALRRFFLGHVTGRGTIPSIRVGRQPYGVLLTSAFGRWKPSDEELRSERLFTATLLRVMGTAYAFWRELAAAVPHVGLNDPDHRNFMSVVGLQASSATFGARKGVTDHTAWNWLQFDGRFSAFARRFWDALKTGRTQALARLGFNVTQEDLKLAQIAFLSRFEPLDGPVVDGDPELPLSETVGITPFDPPTGRNYIHWLVGSEHSIIKAQTFKLADGTTVPPPKALLYKYLRHALLANASTSALALARLRVPVLATMAIPPEPDSVNVAASHVLTSPQLLDLNARALGLTRNALSLGGYVLDKARSRQITADDPPELFATADLVQALKQLTGLPTARLERLFAEHVDLTSHRLDAWITGLFDQRLRSIRAAKAHANGVCIGAYGYVENLKPKLERPDPVAADTLPPELKDEKAIVTRRSNGGFVHAPSLMHGVTAAVLRNAYLSHANAGDTDMMSVNLSSRRVRLAMDYVEGIRNGQELGALLGYQLERGLHENHPGLELDEFIYVLRDRFPFVSRKISPVPDGTAAEVTEARNVVNGYDLFGAGRGKTYPYGIAGLPAAGGAPAAAIAAEIARLGDAMDALGDLMLAESVHQVVGGNYERARSVLQALGEGEVPPIPDVAETPRSGRLLVQRIAIHFADGPGWTGNPPATPRAAAAPRLNHWLTLQLPDPASIGLTFVVNGIPEIVTLADTGLDALDVVLGCGPAPGGGATALERFIVDAFRSGSNIAEDVRLFFKLKDPAVPEAKALVFDPGSAATGGVALEALWPLLNQLRELITRGRPLDTSDYRPSTGKVEDRSNPKGLDGAAPPLAGQADYVARVAAAIASLDSARAALAAKLAEPALKARSEALFADPPAAFVVADWTADLAALRVLLRDLATFGVSEAVPASTVDPVAPAEAEAAARALVTQAQTLLALAQKRVAAAQKANTPPSPSPPPADAEAAVLAAAAARQALVDRLGRALREALGADMPLTPLFGLTASAAASLSAASADPIAPDTLAMETWLQSLSRVRDAAGTLAWVASGREWLLGAPLDMVPVQIPRAAGDPWIGGATGAADLPGEVISVMAVTPPPDPTQPLAGLMLDDWSELVPEDKETTGLAFHFDRPSACAPQAVLLAVSPTLDGAWEWADLVAIVEETFERAKIRAVEPDSLIGTDYFQALPTTLVEFSTGHMYLSTLLVENAVSLMARPS